MMLSQVGASEESEAAALFNAAFDETDATEIADLGEIENLTPASLCDAVKSHRERNPEQAASSFRVIVRPDQQHSVESMPQCYFLSQVKRSFVDRRAFAVLHSFTDRYSAYFVLEA